jgi:hypothetical protein
VQLSCFIIRWPSPQILIIFLRMSSTCIQFVFFSKKKKGGGPDCICWRNVVKNWRRELREWCFQEKIVFKQHVLSSNLKKIFIILKVDWGNSLCACVHARAHVCVLDYRYRMILQLRHESHYFIVCICSWCLMKLVYQRNCVNLRVVTNNEEGPWNVESWMLYQKYDVAWQVICLLQNAFIILPWCCLQLSTYLNTCEHVWSAVKSMTISHLPT